MSSEHYSNCLLPIKNFGPKKNDRNLSSIRSNTIVTVQGVNVAGNCRTCLGGHQIKEVVSCPVTIGSGFEALNEIANSTFECHYATHAKHTSTRLVQAPLNITQPPLNQREGFINKTDNRNRFLSTVDLLKQPPGELYKEKPSDKFQSTTAHSATYLP